MREIKIGDVYLKDENQIIIFYGSRPAADAKLENYITAVFGDSYSGNFGVTSGEYTEATKTSIVCEDPRFTYIGNLKDIFRKVLDV